MQRLVKVVFWSGDIIVEFLRDGPPGGVDDTQGCITFFYVRHDAADGPQVAYHFERLAFFDHFPVNRVDMFWAAEYFCLNPVVCQNLMQMVDDLGDHFLTILPALCQIFSDLAIFIGIEVTEG